MDIITNTVEAWNTAYGVIYNTIENAVYAGLDAVGLGQTEEEQAAGQELYRNVTNPGWWVSTLSDRYLP